jgi:hypothetical protein
MMPLPIYVCSHLVATSIICHFIFEGKRIMAMLEKNGPLKTEVWEIVVLKLFLNLIMNNTL